MNQFKKNALFSLLFATQVTTTISHAQETAPTAEQTIDITMQRIQKIPFYISNLSSSDFLAVGCCAVVGAAIGHISTCAIAHLLDKNTNIELSFYNPEKWGKSLWLGTVSGAIILGRTSLTSFGPESLAQQVNQPLLTVVIGSEPNDLKNTLDGMYVSNRFARAAAFRDLDILRNTLSLILNSFTKLKGKAGYSEAKSLTPVIMSYIAQVKDAMLNIKNDPRWLEECNASTLAMQQATMNHNHNAQLAGAVVQLAHSR